MKLYFVRHGQTDWNAQGRFQGSQGDSPLTEQGVEDAKSLGQALSSLTFDRSFTSPLHRAQETLSLLLAENNHFTHPEVVSDLREWNLGRLEGQSIATLKSIYPKEIDAFYHNLAQFHTAIFSADSVPQTLKRFSDFIYSLEGQGLERVLIVSHGAILTASIRHLLGYETAQLRQAGGLLNTSLTVLETQDFQSFNLIDWNDTNYEAIANKVAKGLL